MTALIELKGARQQAGDRRRRWFGSNDMDLIVWSDKAGSVDRFELYYDKGKNEHVFIWRAGGEISHLAVDDGEQKPVLNYKQAPILVPDGHIDPNHIRRVFLRSKENLPPGIVRLVLRRLEQHPSYREEH